MTFAKPAKGTLKKQAPPPVKVNDVWADTVDLFVRNGHLDEWVGRVVKASHGRIADGDDLFRILAKIQANGSVTGVELDADGCIANYYKSTWHLGWYPVEIALNFWEYDSDGWDIDQLNARVDRLVNTDILFP